MPEYQCCLCGIINSYCTRKCFTCGSKERRICDRCCASRNKCLECQDGSSSGRKIATDDGAATSKKKRSVSFADHDDCSSVNSGKSAKSSPKSKGFQEEDAGCRRSCRNNNCRSSNNIFKSEQQPHRRH
jgi:hypothetical protein